MLFGGYSGTGSPSKGHRVATSVASPTTTEPSALQRSPSGRLYLNSCFDMINGVSLGVSMDEYATCNVGICGYLRIYLSTYLYVCNIYIYIYVYIYVYIYIYIHIYIYISIYI